jgi:hypothetical protein
MTEARIARTHVQYLTKGFSTFQPLNSLAISLFWLCLLQQKGGGGQVCRGKGKGGNKERERKKEEEDSLIDESG